MDDNGKEPGNAGENTTNRVLAAVSGIEDIAIGARSAVDAVAGDVANHAGRLDTVEAGLASLAGAARVAGEGGGLLQEIVDFLHRLFPGHGAPGIPGGGKPSVPPADPPAPVA